MSINTYFYERYIVQAIGGTMLGPLLHGVVSDRRTLDRKLFTSFTRCASSLMNQTMVEDDTNLFAKMP